MYEYKVVEVREQFWARGGMNGQKLQDLLNEHAAQGWQLKAITRTEVKGRVTRETEGVLVTFERTASS